MSINLTELEDIDLDEELNGNSQVAPGLNNVPTQAPGLPLEAAPGLTQQQPMAAPGLAPSAAIEPTPVDPNDFASAIGRGVDQMQADIGGTISVAGQLAGSQFLQDYGQNMTQENQEEAAEYGIPESSTYKDVDVTDVGSIGQYVKNVVGQALPSFSTASAGALAGQAIGAPLGTPGRIGGSLIGGFLASIGVNVGSVENQMKEVDPKQNHPWTALMVGGSLSALDAVGVHAIASPLLKHFGRDAAYELMVQSGIPQKTALEAMTQAAAGVGKGALAEGATSAAQSVIQDVAVAGATDTRMNPEDIMDRAIDSALAGGIIGGTARGATTLTDIALQNADAIGSAVSPQARPVDPDEFKPTGILSRAFQAIGSASTDLLEPLTKASPEAKAFKEEFRADMTGKTASRKTIFEDQELQAGKWTSQFNEITRGMDDAALNELIRDASTPNPQTPEGIKFRKLQDDVVKEAKTRGGLDVGYLQGHMPFGLDPDKVMTPEFLQVITPYYKTPSDALKALDEWLSYMSSPNRGNVAPEVENLLVQNPTTGKMEVNPRFRKEGDPDSMRYQFAQSDTVPKFGHLEESRAFGQVPQQLLNYFTLNQSGKDRAREIKDYYEGAAHRIAFAERFGASGEKANARIVKAVKEAQEKGKTVTKEEVDRMYDLVNSYNGMYGRIKNEQLKNLVGIGTSIAVLSRLPLSGFSTLAEFAIPFAKASVGTAMRQVFPTFVEGIRQAMSGIISRMPQSDVGRFMSDMNLTLEAATSLAADRIGANVFNQTGQKLTRTMFLLNGMSVMTHMNRIFAVKCAESVFNNNLMDLASGLPFTSANGSKKLNQLREMGVQVDNPQQARSLVAPSTPAEVLYANQVKAQAVRRFVDQSVLDPTFADKPMWMNNGYVGVMGLLKGYPAAYGNIIVPMLGRRLSPINQGNLTNVVAGAAGVAFTVGLMMALGTLQDDLRNRTKAAYSDFQDPRTDDQRFLDVFMQQTPLQVSLMWDMLNAERKGTSAVEVFTGPLVGIGGEAVSAVGNTINSFEDDPTAGYIFKFLYQQTPARPFVAGKEIINEEFDIGNY